MNIIELAKEACAPNQTFNSDPEWVERFAALVRAEREWVDLTDDEIYELAKSSEGKSRQWLVWAVIDKIREKNK